MEILITPYSAASQLPTICRACLYWEHPQLFKAHAESERARTLKQAWIGKRAGVEPGDLSPMRRGSRWGSATLPLRRFSPCCTNIGAEP